MPSAGLVLSIMGHTTGSAVRLYQINYIIGLAFGCILYYGVNYFYPPKGLGINEDFDGIDDRVIEGENVFTPADNGSETGVGTKEVNVSVVGKQVEEHSV